MRTTVDINQGVLRIKSVQLTGGHITPAVLREVPLGGIRLKIAELLRDNPALVDGAGIEWPLIPREAAEDVTALIPGRGRPPLSQEFLRQVAIDYLEALGTDPLSPVLSMTTRRHVSRATVSGWIARCRLDGWLTPASQGRAGAKPGQRLIEWVEGNDAD